MADYEGQGYAPLHGLVQPGYAVCHIPEVAADVTTSAASVWQQIKSSDRIFRKTACRHTTVSTLFVEEEFSIAELRAAI